MQGMHRRPLALVPALMLVAGTTVLVTTVGRDDALASDASPTATGGNAPISASTTARRWPAEIEHLLSSMARVDERADSPPMIETDQRCSRVDDGLAHCVMVECQTAGEQTSCVEMVVTARRVQQPSQDEPAPEDDPVEDDFEAPHLMDL